jgi:Tudor domain
MLNLYNIYRALIKVSINNGNKPLQSSNNINENNNESLEYNTADNFKPNVKEKSVKKMLISSETEKDTRILVNELKIKDLPIGNVRVKFLYREKNSSIFNCYESSPVIEGYFKHIETQINEYCKKKVPENYEPIKNEVVLALFEGSYFRAVCLDKKGEKFTVYFIDYGNKVDVNVGEIMPISSKHKFDIVVHKILIENFPTKLTDTIAKILDQEGGVLIEIEKKHEENYYIGKICEL